MEGIGGEMARLYDLFVDWPGRLSREMPGITKRLCECEARRVLDVGCGTGRHVQALLEAGFDACGADVSEQMLEQARELTGARERFHNWRLGDPPPDLGLFDAILCVGNVWPQITSDEDIEASCAAFCRLLRPQGLLLMGLKAFAVRKKSGNPYLPLLRREHEGKPIHFVRFADFTPPPPLCEFHMVVVRGEDECAEHRSRLVRAWSPEALVETLGAAGLSDVRVSGSIGDPLVPPATEDVFVHARTEPCTRARSPAHDDEPVTRVLQRWRYEPWRYEPG